VQLFQSVNEVKVVRFIMLIVDDFVDNADGKAQDLMTRSAGFGELVIVLRLATVLFGHRLIFTLHFETVLPEFFALSNSKHAKHSGNPNYKSDILSSAGNFGQRVDGFEQMLGVGHCYFSFWLE
jgi:hypothetical protein